MTNSKEQIEKLQNEIAEKQAELERLTYGQKPTDKEVNDVLNHM